MNHSKHMAGCMIAVVAGLVVMGVFNIPLGALFLMACPLMMIFMMKGMSQGNGGCEHDHHKDDKPNDPAHSER